MKRIFFLALLFLVVSASAQYTILDEYTARECNGNVCHNTMYSSKMFTYIDTYVTNYDEDSGTWDNFTQREWMKTSDRLSFVAFPSNITLAITDKATGQLLTITPYANAGGTRRSFKWVKDNYGAIFQFSLNKSKNWKWGLDATIPANITLTALGLQFTGSNPETFDYNNGTLFFWNYSFDMRDLYKNKSDWRFTLMNRSALEFASPRQFGNRSIHIDPFISLNTQNKGSWSGFINTTSGAYNVSTNRSQSIYVGRTITPPAGISCGFANPSCRGFITYNLTTLRTDINITDVYFGFEIISITNNNEESNNFKIAITKADPFYNNGTINSSAFAEYFSMNGKNYTTANLSLASVPTGRQDYEAGLVPKDDIIRAINGSTGVFDKNFTIGLVFDRNASASDNLVQIADHTYGVDNSPTIDVWYTNLDNIQFVNPTAPNNTVSVNFTPVNITNNATVNSTMFIDYNRTLRAYFSMERKNTSGIYDNSTWNAFALYGGTGVYGINNFSQAIYGNGTNLDGNGNTLNLTNSFFNYAQFDMSKNWTISLWMYYIWKNGAQRVMQYQQNGSIKGQTVTGNGNNFVVYIYRPQSNTWLNKSYANFFTNNSWVHGTITYDADAGTLTIYKNGATSILTNVGTSTMPAVNGFTFGNGIQSSTAFNGTIDEITIFQRTLSANEVYTLYRANNNNLFTNFSTSNTSNYTIRGWTNDEVGQVNATETRYYFASNGAPNLTLFIPENNKIYSDQFRINFTINVSSLNGNLKNLTLLGNFTGWNRNETNTTTITTGSNYTIWNIALDYGSYIWSAIVCDALSVCTQANYNNTFTIKTAINPSVNITLVSPTNGGIFINSRSMNFTASAISTLGTLKNATLYGNFTGTWSANGTNTTALANGSTYEIRNVPINKTVYLWNMFICDSNDLCSFAPANSTMKMTEQGPTVTLVSPANNTITINNTVLLTGSAVIINTTIHNASLYFGNATVLSLNQTIYDNQTSAVFTLNLSIGQYYWNVQFCQANALCSQASTNSTFSIVSPINAQNETEGFILWFLMVCAFFIALAGFSPEMKILMKILVYWIASAFFIGATLALILVSNSVLPQAPLLSTQLKEVLGMALNVIGYPFYLVLLYFVLAEIYRMAKEGWKHSAKI